MTQLRFFELTCLLPILVGSKSTVTHVVSQVKLSELVGVGHAFRPVVSSLDVLLDLRFGYEVAFGRLIFREPSFLNGGE